ncbi:Vegetative incompatibility protein HET-E-1 [Colletotrichum aenigma]|uniref:Vegetative incompatibility protein HET-E-1 n=1 Tax=Colletotrichum aenigma TaxID=1215731 RepID=UPI00187243F9|nr:Vegetative incompatibility protein HET-E-1 [Colletotrichum aenigma]KAF5527233.1 Vegetative incompatibility protein HET-E-1 [Colletotrichum aenigma]
MAGQPDSLAFQPQPSDILIAVMGITGSGKSTFISLCTDQSVSIGQGLHSETQDIVAYPCRSDVGSNVYLIDTPGFDDTERDDAEILRQIAAWVGESYKQKVHIRGILYLHRITDNVILVTTMWEEVRPNIGKQREEELRTKPGYWGEMIDRGSRIARHHNHYESARNIIHSLVNTTTQTTLAIQKEMVDEKRDLHDTSAGKELDGILTLERERFAHDIEQLKQDMAEARELQDKESQEQIQLLQKQREAEIGKLLQQQETMKVSLEQLHEEKFTKLEQLITTQKSQMEKDKLEITDLKEKLAKSSLTTEPDPADNTRGLEATNYSCLHRLEGHTDRIHYALFSPDSRRIASMSLNGNIKIWDSSTGRLLRTIRRCGKNVRCMAFSPDGWRIAAVSGNPNSGIIKIWDSNTGSCLQKLKGHRGSLSLVAYSPDGHRIASASDQTIRVWNSSTGRYVQTLEDNCGPITRMAYSPNGCRIAAGSEDHNFVKVWDSNACSTVQTFEGHRYSVLSVAYSPNGRFIASGSADKTVKIWDSSTGSCVRTLRGHGNKIVSVAYSPDGRYIASGSYDRTVTIWNSSTGSCLQTLSGNGDSVLSVDYSPDGRYMVSGSADSTVKIWQTNTSM